jgi:hypothetical protein
MVIGHWENPVQPAQAAQMTHHQQMGTVSWQPIQDWSAEDQENLIQQQHYQQLQQQQQQQQQQLAFTQQPQFMHIPFQEAPSQHPLMIPIPTAQTDYMAHHVHPHHQALTQITHATQHSMPIMTTHTQQFVPTKHQESTYYGRGYARPNNNGNSRTSWQKNPEREVTRIPPRFQKQRPQHQTSEKPAAQQQKLPRATSKTPPALAKRLIIFGTSNVVNNLTEADLSEELNIPVMVIPAMKLEDFRVNIGLVDPEKDRMVLIHGLGNDARNIALKTHKSDVDKGAESDGLANEFADVVIDLIERIPYIKILISTLLPRFDSEEQLNMSNPNNVRKVMNVEISMRLQGKPNVVFINNDFVLEWRKDDVKKKRLFVSDGYHLSAYGFSMMFDHWMTTLKTTVSGLGLGTFLTLLVFELFTLIYCIFAFQIPAPLRLSHPNTHPRTLTSNPHKHLFRQLRL